jgi:hypothetical protein
MGLDRPFISEIVRLKGRDSKHSLAAFEQAKLSRDGSRKALSNEVDRASSGLQNIFGRFKPEGFQQEYEARPRGAGGRPMASNADL